MRIALALLFAATLRATTVCSSGCDFTTIQAAINAVPAHGADIIDISPGTYVEALIIDKAGVNITLRSRDWRQLPPPGVRISEGASLPVIQAPAASKPVLQIGREQLYVDAVDTATDTLTFRDVTYSSALPADGVPVRCWGAQVGRLGVLPAPVAYSSTAFVRDYSSGPRTAKLAASPGGSAINLTTAGSAAQANQYDRPRCVRVDGPLMVTLQGLKLTTAETTYVVRMGDNAQTERVADGRLRIYHSILTGAPDVWTGPVGGLALAGGEGHEIRDSIITYVVSRGGTEGVGLALLNTGLVKVENNYIAAQGIGFLIGGTETADRRNVSGVRVERNQITMPGWTHQHTSNAAPSGSCRTGAGWLQSGTTCFRCVGGSWVSGSACQTPVDQPMKTTVEVKEGLDVVIRGNRIGPTNQAVVSAGMGWGLGISAIASSTIIGANAPFVQVSAVVSHNLLESNYVGILARVSTYGGAVYNSTPIIRTRIENNLIRNMGDPVLRTASTSQTGGVYNSDAGIPRSAFFVSTGPDQLSFRKNTAQGLMRYGFFLNLGSGSPQTITNSVIADNLSVPTDYPTQGEEGLANCTDWLAKTSGTTTTRNVFVTSVPPSINWATCGAPSIYAATDPQFQGDGSLAASSPYSAANGSATLLSSDGSDIGADVPAVLAAVAGVDTGTPPVSHRVRLDPAGGVSMAAPSGCSATFYGASRRRPEDVVAAGSVSGRYWYVLTCDGAVAAVGEGAR